MAKRVTLDMQVEHQKCRSRNHAWDDFIAPRNVHAIIYESPHQETLRCLRCGCERFRGIGFTGEVETNIYDYPEGYLMTAEDRPELAVIRLSLIQEIKAAAAQTRRVQEHKAPAKRHARRPAARKGAPRQAAARPRSRARV